MKTESNKDQRHNEVGKEKEITNKTEKPFSLQDDEKEVKNMTKIVKFLNSLSNSISNSPSSSIGNSLSNSLSNGLSNGLSNSLGNSLGIFLSNKLSNAD